MRVRKKLVLSIQILLLGLFAIPTYAGGPQYVTGASAITPGKAYRWNINPITYWTDQGSLGNQSNSQANSLVATAFQKWQSVSTASLSIQRAGQLSYDVKSSNITAFSNAISNCSDTSQPVNSIVFDADGSITTALGYDNNSTLGFTSPFLCGDTATGAYTRGFSVFNGRLIDGSANTPSHQTMSVELFAGVIVHELGHLLGVDHTQINVDCYTSNCSATELSGVPAMFPFLLDLSQATLKTDDIAAISMLYPASNFSTSTGRIQGRIYFSDSRTQAQGYNVIARNVANPYVVAVSSVSGYLYTTSVGDLYDPNAVNYVSDLGSRDADLIGYYDIPGLPPGTYTIEVEAINGDFTSGSGVGPIGNELLFQYSMPGTCDKQYLHYPSSSADSCSAQSTITVSGGYIANTNTNVTLLGTPSRYDQWEDGN
jgi:hypothetical protein